MSRDDKKIWLAMGNSFIKLPREKAVEMLKKDQVSFLRNLWKRTYVFTRIYTPLNGIN
jgi:hypothetical protein